MTYVVVSDIDGTLCVSSRRVEQGQDVVTVDSWPTGSAVTTREGHDAWTHLAAGGSLVPVTTRRRDQLLRMTWPGPFPNFAVVANGAEILISGHADRDWCSVFDKMKVSTGWKTEAAEAALRMHVTDCRLVDTGRAALANGVCLRRPSEEEVGVLSDYARQRGWCLSVQERKIYLCPVGLGKNHAVDWLQRERGLKVVAAAGDSSLDVAMLLAAPRSACPEDSEAHESMRDEVSFLATGPAVERVGLIARWLSRELAALTAES